MREKITYEDTIYLRDKIKSSINIKDVMMDHGVNLTDHSSGLKGTACCPFHNENNPSFSVDYVKGVYYCFSCHEKGDIFSFVENQNEDIINWYDAVEFLCKRYGIDFPAEGDLGINEIIEKCKALKDHETNVNLLKHRELFDRFLLEVSQKIKFYLSIRNADISYVENKIFPLLRIIDDLINKDEFNVTTLENMSSKFDEEIRKIRKKK